MVVVQSYSFVFSFSRCCDPLALHVLTHSFPPRRSSDLSSTTAPARISPGSIPDSNVGDVARSVPTAACQGRFLRVLHHVQRRTADQCAVCVSDHLVK